MREMPKCLSSKKLSIFAFIFVLIADQLSKLCVLFYLNETITITSFFNLVLVKNKGVTFGLFGGIVSPNILVAFALFVVTAIVIFMKKQEAYYRLPTVFIISGAIGNIIDRIRYGAVIDFLDFHLYQYHWPAFNIADMAVVSGVFSLLFISYIEENKS